MERQIAIALGEYDWSAIMEALYKQAGELAASEARRTGGRGYSSDGIKSHVDRIHRIMDKIREAKTPYKELDQRC